MYTIDECLNIAKKYYYRSDLLKNEPNVYDKLRRNKLLQVACQHMPYKLHHGTYTLDYIKEKMSLCKTKSEFNKKYPYLYKIIKKNQWEKETDGILKQVGNRYFRCIYACEFSNSHVYVGLTYDFQKRQKQHLTCKNSTIYQYISQTNDIPIFIQKTDYIECQSASKKEGEILNYYKDNGWTILNKAKTGGLGSALEKKQPKGHYVNNELFFGRKYWTKEKCYTEALKYKTKKELRENAPTLYNISLRNEWFSDYYWLKDEGKKFKYWTKERCLNEALKYKNRKDLFEKSNSCYQIICRNGWANEAFKHMANLGNERRIYNETVVIKELSNYNYMEQLKKSNNKFTRGCYWWLKRRKLLIEFKKYLKHE